MANATLGHRRFDGKPTTTAFNMSSFIDAMAAATALPTAPVLGGLVQHRYVDADTQVAILAAIDETGSAPLEDIVAALPSHPKPAGAALAMVSAGVLRIHGGIVDANIRLSRATAPHAPDEDGADAVSAAPNTNGNDAGTSPNGAVDPEAPAVREVLVPLYAPAIFWSWGQDRARLRRAPMLVRGDNQGETQRQSG